MTPKSRATLAAVGSILLWCWSGVCFAVGSRLAGAMPYLALMTATGSLTVVALQAVRRRPLVALVALPARLIGAGFFGVALYTVLFCQAMGLAAGADLGQVNLINYLWPVWLAVLSLLLLEERPRPGLTLLGTAIGFAGVAVARGIDQLFVVPVSLVPHALTGAGSLLWALYCVLLRRWRVPEEQGGTALHFAVCAAMASGIAAVTGAWAAWPGWSPALAFWVLFGGVGPVGLAYHFWEIGMKRGDVRLIGQLAYFTPVGSSLLIGVFFRGTLSAGLGLGVLLIVVGALVARRAAAGSAALAALLLLGVTAPLAGCESGASDAGRVVCTTEARASVTVSVVDSAGAPLGGGAVTWRVDGGPSQPGDCVDFAPPPEGCSRFVAGWEVPGTVRVEAAKPGFLAAAATVVVEMDEVGCHVVGHEIELRLLAL